MRGAEQEKDEMPSTITDYEGKVAVVTGGASGIGKGICEELAKDGAKVVIADIEQHAIDAAVKEISGNGSGAGEISGVQTDVSRPESVEALADAVYERYGVCHILFNNAGVGAPGANVWDTTPNDWRWTFQVNVFGVAYGIQSFVPRMLAGGEPGHIVNTSSGDGAIGPLPMASIYASSKSAVAIITECLAAQLEDQGTNLRASLFLPGGRGLLATGLYSSERNRPPELTREKERPTKPTTVEDIVAQARAAGREIPLQDLNELGRDVLEQIKAGVYCIQMFGNEASAQRLHERADRFGQGLNPTVAHDFNP